MNSQVGGEWYWALTYFLAALPSAISFTIKERIFADAPTMNIFVVNTLGSIMQLVFAVLYLPLVVAPGFGAVPWDELGSYLKHGCYCLVGLSLSEHVSH